MSRDPVGQRRIAAAGEIVHQPGQQPAVVGKIVAAQQRQAAVAGSAPGSKAGHDQADGGSRCRRIGQIVHDIGMRRIKHAAGGQMTIAFFGYGERHDVAARRSDGRNHRARIFGRHQHIGDGPDDLQMFCTGGLFNNREQALLRHQLIAHAGAAQ